MDFDFSSDQLVAREQLRQLLARECPLSSVRALALGEARFNAQAWRALGESGYLGAAVPEMYGGAGLGPLELCIAAEEIGRSLAALPFNTSIAFAVELISTCGSEAQKQRYLPQLCAGEVIACAGSLAGSIQFDGYLNGEVTSVLDGVIADLALIDLGDRGGRSVLVVQLDQPGVQREALRSIDPTRTHARLMFKEVPAEFLGEPCAAAPALRRARQRAAIMLAFEQLGGADRCLELARDYACERRSFGRPIGSFQAIKHKLVDMHVKNTLARSHAYYGAWALSARADAVALAAAAAFAAAGTAFLHAAEEAVEVFGAIAATWEHDAHLFQRRARLLASQWGGVHAWKDQLVACLVSGQGAAAHEFR